MSQRHRTLVPRVEAPSIDSGSGLSLLTQREHDDALTVAAALAPEYMAVRVLADGSVAALRDLVFTRAIFLDCDIFGWGRRFCFEDRALAAQRFDELVDAGDEPQGYIARRWSTALAS